jgi:hypothetical protein
MATPASAPDLDALIAAIVADDLGAVRRLLRARPGLAREASPVGADRANAEAHFFAEITHYRYRGDTALHLAAAGHRGLIVAELLAKGADVEAVNRRGARPLHYAADGGPGIAHWDQAAQAGVIRQLIAAGAAVDAVDAGGVTALHRAVRNRCAAAVAALIAGGADVHLANAKGSTPLRLAGMTTGRSGSGSAAARAGQEEIIRLLREEGAV